MKLLILALSIMLAGCSGQAPTGPELAQLVPPIEAMTADPPLPDIPACDAKKTVQERVSCRAAYDSQIRNQCVGIARDKQTLAAWIKEVTKHEQR